MRPVAVVVGAGVNGLTCAVRLLEAGARVVEKLSLATTSTRLAAHFFPEWPRLCRLGRALHLQGQAREDRVAGSGRHLGVSPGALSSRGLVVTGNARLTNKSFSLLQYKVEPQEEAQRWCVSRATHPCSSCR
jgi:glycine/D-amino acid oxidase-like deaminating enzyme